MKEEVLKNDIDMLSGPLLKRMILFALPLAIGSILQVVFNMTDTAVVGRFAGAKAMAAVGGNTAIINLLVSLFIGLSIGANVVIARAIGEKREERIKAGIQTTIALSIVGGLLLMVIGICLSGFLLEITGVPNDVMSDAKLYLIIYFIGTPFLVIYNFGASILRSRGDSKRPLYILIFTGCLNVILNLVLVIIFKLGVAGVGIATLVSNIVNMIVMIYILEKEPWPYKVCLKELYFDKKVVIDILKIGIPSGLQGMVFSFSNTVIQSSINSFGSTYIAGSTAAFNFEAVGYFGINSFANAATTFTGQNFGAGNYKRCRKIFWEAVLCGAIVTGVLNGIGIIFREPLIGLFTTEVAVLAVAKVRFLYVLSLQWIAASYEISGACLRGMGYSMTPTLIAIIGTCGFRLLWVAFVFPQFNTFESLIAVYPITWIITGITTVMAYFIITRREINKVR